MGLKHDLSIMNTLQRNEVERKLKLEEEKQENKDYKKELNRALLQELRYKIVECYDNDTYAYETLANKDMKITLIKSITNKCEEMEILNDNYFKILNTVQKEYQIYEVVKAQKLLREGNYIKERRENRENLIKLLSKPFIFILKLFGIVFVFAYMILKDMTKYK